MKSGRSPCSAMVTLVPSIAVILPVAVLVAARTDTATAATRMNVVTVRFNMIPVLLTVQIGF